MKLMRFSEKLGYLNKNIEKKQEMLTLGESYSLWSILGSRYDALIKTKILLKFVKDDDLKVIITRGLQTLERQKENLEQLMEQYCISMPNKPPEHANIVVDNNAFTDQFIFREIFNGMQNITFKHLSNYFRAHSSILKETFRNILNEELDLYDSYYEYGKQKSYLHESPSFRV